MKLIVGLGNPGAKYTLTRHNVGFMAVDWLLKSLEGPGLQSKSEFKSLISKFKWDGVDVIVAQPQTYMNLSGEAVQPLLSYYRMSLDDLLVIQDEVDLAFGQIKLQRNRGHAGNNGIRDITERLGSADYRRIRIGVGKSANPNVPLADHVLQRFNDDEMTALPGIFEQVIDLIEANFLKA